MLERIIRTHQLRIENVSAAWAALRMYRYREAPISPIACSARRTVRPVLGNGYA